MKTSKSDSNNSVYEDLADIAEKIYKKEPSLFNLPKLEETIEAKKARLKEEFFTRNVDRLKTFHEQHPHDPVPIRWDETKQDYMWVTLNRETRRRIILTDE